MREIVENCTHGIDLHTGSLHRANLPQVRANLDDAETLRLAQSFGVPVLINANVRDGSLREAAAEHGISMLLYEAGEALRFDEISIRAGLHGIINVMRALAMLPASRGQARRVSEPFVARLSTWTRAPESGILRTVIALGARVRKGDLLGVIADPFGEKEAVVPAPHGGVIIGRTQIPLVHEGEALYHIARFEDAQEVAEHVEAFHSTQVEAIDGDSEPAIV